jgi:spermidine synthase
MVFRKSSPYILILLSGFTCLVFQLLWMRQLGLLFGNTAHATAMTLAVFFAGLALGSWFWGGKAATSRNPMLAFAGLEIGIAFTALLYFLVIALFHAIYPAIYQNMPSPPFRFAIKVLLACLLIMPPSFLMGGTVPMMGQALIRHRDAFGRRAAGLYAVNTIGAAFGAFATGFFLVRIMGFTWTCITAICITCAIAAVAYRLGSTQAYGSRTMPTDFNSPPQPRTLGSALPMYAVCFLSGFGFLALEVAWTHLLSQIHTNSIYSFSAVLVMVLGALGLGAAAAAQLAKLRIHPSITLALLLIMGGLAVTLSPFVFMQATNGFQMLYTGGSFLHFMQDLFGKGALLVGLPAFFLAMIFPFIMKVEERFSAQPGQSLGRLSALDTLGAIIGALLSGFVFLAQFGIWRTVQGIAALYLLAAILIPITGTRRALGIRTAAVLVMVALFTWLSPADLRVTGWNPARPPEELLELWETSHGTVSVVRNEHSGYVIKLNSNYWLGSTGAAWQQHYQGRIPLLAFPQTRTVFFLGMGTGISAGGALDPRFTDIERVVACELIPEVVTAARNYMTRVIGAQHAAPIDFTSGLFTDKRVEIIVEDGRHYLMASGKTFDMINGDLFLPYQQGAGSLYSREHFENAKASLNPGGVFVQWLPMFQLTEFEFGVIARTMLEVFDQVTMWRNNFKPGQEAVALIGHQATTPLPPATSETIASRTAEVAGKNPLRMDRLDLTFDEETALVFYCGNLTAVRPLFLQYPLNTDDRPVIEYAAPLSIRKKVDGFAPTLVGPRFVTLIDTILQHCPPESDPMLARRSAANKRLVRAGAELHRFWVAKAMNQPRNAATAWTYFVAEWTNQQNPQ